MRDLLLTLGHNASAIAVEDGNLIAGYEEERLSKIKSDSHFPEKAIAELGFDDYDRVYVSHWEPFADVNKMKDKHWQPSKLPFGAEVISLNKDFTHHDAHMWSAKAFLGADVSEMDNPYYLVVDGFGNFGECISVYTSDGELIHRVHGYNGSLGLMYQYATANIGLKMNEDEYKLLGYESQITDKDALALEPVIAEIFQYLTTVFMCPQLENKADPLYNISALVETQVMWDDLLEPCERDKVKVAYVVQSVIERMLMQIIQKFQIHDVVLVGGCFLNVKLNYRIMERVNGKVAVMPLSGDQGAALGLYKYHNPDFVMPKHLFWGKRKLERVEHEKVMNFDDHEEMEYWLHRLLTMDQIVNIVWGAMEFGPRALCHTSTIATPTMENVHYINKLNGRATVMPMGPVVSEGFAENNFLDYHKSLRSHEFMITAMEYHDVAPSIRGAAHNLPHGEGFTGRPQVIGSHDPLMKVMGKSLDEFGILINTSFNIHGVPIVYDSNDVLKCVKYQDENDTADRVWTLVYTGDEHV